MSDPTKPHADLGFGEDAPELVAVIEPGALTLGLPEPPASGDEVALDGLLSDALFGEVIDISDLIPRLLSPSAETVPSPQLESATDPVASLGEPMGLHGDALTILYDDDMLMSAGATG